MPTQQQIQAINAYVQFAQQHALRAYGTDVATIPAQALDNELVWAPLGPQLGMFLGPGIGSRTVRQHHGLGPATMVLLGDIGVEIGAARYFGVIFHEFGHATFHALGANSEDGAWCMEATTLTDAVVAGLVPLTDAQTYTQARVDSGMLQPNIPLVGNAVWRERYRIARDYLLNQDRHVVPRS